MDYKHLDIQKLIELVKYDDDAQIEIIERTLMMQIKNDSWTSINPFGWENIFEKCCNNEKYVFMLLCAYKSIILSEIDSKIITLDIKNFFGKLYPVVKQRAKNGNSLAQNDLGFMYEEDIGIIGKTKKAKKWYALSANQGLSFAQYNLGYYYIKKNKYEKAIDCFQKSMQSGCYVSNYMLAETYLKLSVPNHDQAIKLFTISANKGYIYSQYRLGILYYDGIHIPININEAIKWFLMAANQGCDMSQNKLGVIYFEGKHINVDINQAYKWFKLSTKQGNYFAEYGLGRVYDSKYFTKYNCQKAINCYIKAANNGYIYPQKKLIEYYEKTDNIAEMIYWCIKSSDITKIQKYIKINESVETTNDIAYFDLIRKNLEDTGLDIIYKCQLLIIQNKYYWRDDSARERVKSCEKLESTILKFIDWNDKLQNNPLLLLSCLSFIDDNHNISIRHHQHATELIPYVKQHEFRNKKFITFGKENVSFVNEIINITNGIDVHEWFENLQCLKLDYQNLISTTSMDSAKIYQDLDLIQKLEIDIEKYCELMLDEIEYGAQNRNHLFRENGEFPMVKLFDN
ncbi:Sel1-like repeat-containing protein [Megavirus chiliensis]|uniref:Sel1-like repeat-containing n=2 Tax=Megamimivirinae TaxID=3044648 RepID=A0A2L2DNZ8_MIMIV|nr:putative Sel1-like repeat-containing protein [Megavirus chiliensis]AEQ33361.1 Sel1-like repeat-containing protein [Megavirus chiliensis]AVG47883.1 Sel1-like repeat-containing [Acanthamoeba polyphaga mimivirus]